MNFDWKAEAKEMRQRVSHLMDSEALADIAAMEDADLPALQTATLRQLGRLGEIGYLGAGLDRSKPEEMMTLLAAQEELAAASGSLFLAAESSARLFGCLVAEYGGPELQALILDPLQSGRIIGAAALSEPGGVQPTPDWQTTARRDGDEYLITGVKSAATNGPLADWLAVSCAVDGRPAVAVVRPGLPGLTVGPRFKTLGYNGLAVSSLELTGVRVPAGQVLGPFDDDRPFSTLKVRQDLILAVASLGLIRRTLNAANRHARSHHRGSKPIYAHQEVRFKIADMLTLHQTAQLMTYRAAWFLSQGDKEAEALIACAKVFASEAAEKVSGLAMQILAGQGYLSGNVVERGYREAKYAPVAGTTSEVSRMNIADYMLKVFSI